MKSWLHIVLMIAICVTTLRADTMHVMTFNIRYNNPADGVNAWPHRKDWVAEIVVNNETDLVGFQEVRVEQLNDLKARLPAMDSYGVGRDDGRESGEFVPIFYREERFELIDKGTFWLSKTPEIPGSKHWDAAITRITSWVKLRDKNTEHVFYLLNTHFDHKGAEARLQSAELLVARLRMQFADHPVILTGDFNTTPATPPYEILVSPKMSVGSTFQDAFERSSTKPTGPDSTWNGFTKIVPQQRIDFIFITNSVEVLQLRTIDDQREGRFPSDHLPVWSEIAIKK